jgi:16S rRNA (guanine527-N7)-methyltransferase
MTLEIMLIQLEKRGMTLDHEQKSKFAKYLELLKYWNEHIDLTSLKTDADIIEKHFYDSLLISSVLNMEQKKVIDIGSGAGFPGIPLKILIPSANMTLLEPTQKRCVFLECVIKELDLKDIIVENARAEDFVIKHRETFDIALARAVAPLNILSELSIPLLKVGGLFVAMKGPSAEDELTNARKALAIMFSSIEKIQRTTLFTNGDIRNNIIIKKNKQTPGKYPRRYAEIKSNPL